MRAWLKQQRVVVRDFELATERGDMSIWFERRTVVEVVKHAAGLYELLIWFEHKRVDVEVFGISAKNLWWSVGRVLSRKIKEMKAQKEVVI